MPDNTRADSLSQARVPVVGFAAYSGTGKTTLLTHLIPILRGRGIRLAGIKHSHHKFDIDQPGKDSYRLRKAGIDQMLVASRCRWALMVENASGATEPRLDELIGHIDQSQVDLILIEGFKHEDFPKIELHRPALAHPLLCPEDPQIIALASDAPVAAPGCNDLVRLNLNDPPAIAEFLIQRFALPASAVTADEKP